MNKKLYAHSANKNGQPQTLEEHSINVASKASEFAKSFNSDNWAYNIGLLHDLGKASMAFQEYLNNAANIDSDEDGSYVQKTNHSGAGAIFAIDKYKDIGKILAYCIAGHHAGLADYNGGQSSLSFRIYNNGGNDKKYIDKQVKEFEKEKFLELKALTNPPLKNCGTDLHLWIRMLYSCLVDADFIDTETHIHCAEKDRGKFNSIKELSEKFFCHMKKFENPKNNLNKLRNEVFEKCRQAGESKEGFFELTVPTGGGKTLSSMAFAFEHAKKYDYDKNRIIYVIPYTSIIEQTSKILKDILGEENVVEHHSNIDSEKETEKSRLACENWDAPIIVTTNVQFFESLYANKSSKCRKLHNIANSIIILDEAQMLPPELLYPIEDIMRQLIDNYKCSIVFSTATQPYFETIKNIEKIIPESMDLYGKLKRVKYHLPEKQETWEEIAEKLKQQKQALCVVNTRKDCYDLYQLTKIQGDTIHLSALMCAEHRSKKITEIKEKLKNKANIRLISTQLIEAGVDIDFPVVYRAFAGLSSIIQTAGRCNREGKAERGEVFIFNPPTQIPAGIMLKAANAYKSILSLDGFDMDNAENSKQFFQRFIASVNSTGKKEWYDNLVKDAYNQVCQFNIEFASYAKKFQLIDDWNKAVIVRYMDNGELIEQLRYAGISRDLMRKLQRYIVNISPKVLTDLLSKGLIEEIHEGIYVQDKNTLYSEEIGLNIFGNNYGIEICTV